MINRKIAMSGMSILASLALMGGATFAFFSDSGTSTGNTFSTGTLDLKLADADETTGTDSVTASFGSGSLVPGSCTGDQTLFLRNDGTIAANHAEVRVSNVVTDTGSNATPDMDAYLRINKLTYDDVDVTGQITNNNISEFLDLNDWATGSGLDNLSLTNLNSSHALVLDVCLDSSAPNEIQADSVLSTFTVDLNQNASQ